MIYIGESLAIQKHQLSSKKILKIYYFLENIFLEFLKSNYIIVYTLTEQMDPVNLIM